MKDFCLKDERKKLYKKMSDNLEKGFSLDRLFMEVTKQDKEFIKILKEKEIIKKYGSIDIVKTGTVKIEDIDKLTGDLE